MNHPAIQAFMLLFVLTFGAAAFVFMLSSIVSAYRGWASMVWPCVPGIINASRVEVNKDADGTTYQLHVAYTYTVDGIAYRGQRLSFGDLAAFGPYVRFNSIAKRYADGKPVFIYYDPKKPGLSVLEPGLHWDLLLFFLFGAFLLCIDVSWILPVVFSR